jgi:hypothetical protein
MNETIPDAKCPENLLQAVVPHPVECLLEVNKIVEQVLLML